MEVLVGGAIGAVIMLGSVKGLSIALQAGGVSRSILTENDFRMTLSKAVNHCWVNFKPEKITNSDSTKKSKGIGALEAIYSVAGGQEVSLISKGVYKRDIEVVKMELRGDPTENRRSFIAFYKKIGLGDLNTVGGGECSESNTEGCFYQQCELDYTWDDQATTDIDEGSCQKQNCYEFSDGSSLANINCEETHGSGFSIAGFDDQGKPICKNLTADANPCPFGTKLKGYKTDGKPDCTAKRNCDPNYLLQIDGSCLLKDYSYDGARCIKKSNETDAKEVCANQANLRSHCRWVLIDRGNISLKTHAHNAGGEHAPSGYHKKYKAKIFRRGLYNRATGNFTCYNLETPEFIVRTTSFPSHHDNPETDPLDRQTRKPQGNTQLWDKADGTLRDKINSAIERIFTWQR